MSSVVTRLWYELDEDEIGLLPGNVTAEQLGLDPVHGDQDAVTGCEGSQYESVILRERKPLTAKAHAQISTAPEKIGHGSTTGNVTTQPADVCHGTLLSDVSQATLVRVLEGTNLLNPAQLLLALPDLVENLVTVVVVLGLALDLGEPLQFLLDGLGLGHGVEQTGQESTFLAGNLGSGGVVGDGTVTNSPDVLCAVDDQVLVHGKTAARVLLSGDLAHEVTDDVADRVTGGPNQQTVRDCLNLLGTVRLGDLSLDLLVVNALDHSLGANGDGLLLEGRFGVVDQLLGEHGKHVGQGLDKSDVEVVLDIGNPLLKVVVEEILDFTGELDTSGATTNDNHMQKSLDFLLGLILEHGSLNAVHDTLADLLGIANVLQEAGVLLDTLDT